MGSRSASGWKILIGLAVVCGILVFLGGFLHRRALEESVQKAQDASTAYVKTKLSHAVEGIDLSQPLKDTAAESLTKDVDLPDGDEVRIFAVTGTPVYSSPGLDAFSADDEALHTAATGDPSRVIDGSDMRVYAPIVGKAQHVAGVAAVVTSYTQLRRDASGPLDALRLPLVGLGVVLLIAGLYLMLQSTKGSAPVRATGATSAPAAAATKGRVTGFEPVVAPTEPAAVQAAEAPGPDAAPPTQRFGLRLGRSRATADVTADATQTSVESAPAKPKRALFGKRSSPEPDGVVAPGAASPAASTSALDREVAIRQALEDQLEQLRTQVKMHEDERVNAVRELNAQLEEATRRAETADALVRGSDASVDPPSAANGAVEQVAALEQELARAKATAAEAIARADDVQRAAAAARVAAPADPGAEQRAAETAAQLQDAQQRATSAEQRAASAEQRAASVESVRDELEVRVAQLGAKTGEVEQRASELEAKLGEANAGGDAVRAEIATMTAALAAANARVHELESASPASGAPDADRAEISRLRGELAKQMERAQAAEDRIATLEADVAAATRGVTALSPERPPTGASTPSPEHAPPTVALTYDQEPTTVDRHAEPVEARDDVVPPAPAGDDRYDDMWTTALSAPTQPPARESSRSVDPTPEPAVQPRSPQEAEPEPPSEAEPEAAPTHTAEPTPAAASEDEAPGADEAELSPDDMWSLRARLADAAARKRHHIE
jgi:hypothetical protein